VILHTGHGQPNPSRGTGRMLSAIRDLPLLSWHAWLRRPSCDFVMPGSRSGVPGSVKNNIGYSTSAAKPGLPWVVANSAPRCADFNGVSKASILCVSGGSTL